MGYENARRIDMSGALLYGESIPSTSIGSYEHDTATWPMTVYDFSGYATYRIQSGTKATNWGGCLITPRHVVSCFHTFPDMPVGSKFVFTTPAGDEIERTVTATSVTSGPQGVIGGDIYLMTLDSAATGCKVYPLATAASDSTLVGTTILCPTREREIETRIVETVGSYISHVADETGDTVSDSGQPAFTTRAGELVLLGTHHFADHFPNLARNLSTIQSYCDAVGETIQTVSVDPATWVQPLTATLEDAAA